MKRTVGSASSNVLGLARFSTGDSAVLIWRLSSAVLEGLCYDTGVTVILQYLSERNADDSPNWPLPLLLFRGGS